MYIFHISLQNTICAHGCQLVLFIEKLIQILNISGQANMLEINVTYMVYETPLVYIL